MKLPTLRKRPKVKIKGRASSGKKLVRRYTIREKYSYLEMNKQFISVFRMSNKFGANHEADGIGWFSRILPMASANADYTFIERARTLPKTRRDEIEDKYLETSEGEAKDNSKAKTFRGLRNQDRRLFATELAAQRSLVASDAHLIVKSVSEGGVDQGIKRHRNRITDMKLTGLRFTRLAGSQKSWFERLFKPFHPDRNSFIEPSSLYSRRMQLKSRGFNDRQGMPIGSPVQIDGEFNPMDVSIMDFNDFRKQVVIGGNGSFAPRFVWKKDGQTYKDSTASGASIIAQSIANESWMRGKRVHHIMLRDVPYKSPDALEFDMSKEAINPLEVYGDWENIQSSVQLNFDKLIKMFDLLSGNKLNEYSKSNLAEVINDFYVNRANGNGIWTNDVEHEELKARKVLANEFNHQYYPKMAELIPALHNNVAVKSNQGEMSLRDAQQLETSLSNAVDSSRNVFNKATTLPDFIGNDHNQIYYNLETLDSNNNIYMAQLLNVLSYVSATVREGSGDLVIIHGADNITKNVAPLVAEFRKRFLRRGIRLVWAFDENELDGKERITALDDENVYGELNKDVDYYVMSRLTPDAFEKLNAQFNGVLPSVVKDVLTDYQEERAAYISRAKDGVNSPVLLEVLL